jgi:hypothetical protein
MPDRGQVRGLEAGLGRGTRMTSFERVPDLHRVVLDPARLRVDLLVLFLVDADHPRRSGRRS